MDLYLIYYIFTDLHTLVASFKYIATGHLVATLKIIFNPVEWWLSTAFPLLSIQLM